MAEKEQQQMHHMQRETVVSHRISMTHDFKLAVYGRIWGFILSLLLTLMGGLLVYQGAIAMGISISLGPLLGVIVYSAAKLWLRQRESSSD